MYYSIQYYFNTILFHFILFYSILFYFIYHFGSLGELIIASGYKFIGVKPLEEDAALTKGINFFSESFIFLVAGSIITFEYWKSEEKSALAKEAAAVERKKADARLVSIEERLSGIEYRINGIDNRINGIDPIRINDIETRIHDIEHQNSKKDRSIHASAPPAPKSPSIWYNMWSSTKDFFKAIPS